MSVFTIPHTFAGDTVLQAASLDTCFQYARDYINGANGGIDSTNLSTTMGIGLSQLAQPRTVGIVTAYLPAVRFATTQGYYVSIRSPVQAEVIGVRVHVDKTTPANPVRFNWNLFPFLGQQQVALSATSIVAQTYDDTQAQNWGDFRPPIPGQSVIVPPGGGLTVWAFSVSGDGPMNAAASNVAAITFQVKLATTLVNY